MQRPPVTAQRTFAVGSTDSDNESGEQVKPDKLPDRSQAGLWENACSNYEHDARSAGSVDTLLLD